MAATRTPTETTAREALTRCVEPIGAAEFLAEYWEQRPLAVPRAEEGRFDDLLSVADVERLVSSGGLRTPGLRLVKEGGTIAESAWGLGEWMKRSKNGVTGGKAVIAHDSRNRSPEFAQLTACVLAAQGL